MANKRRKVALTPGFVNYPESSRSLAFRLWVISGLLVNGSESEERGSSFVLQIRLAEPDFQFAFFIEPHEDDPGWCQPQRRPQKCVQRLEPHGAGDEAQQGI